MPAPPKMKKAYGGAPPPPGSDEALELGCKCPVLDNAHGRGAGGYGPNAFWVNAECPIHGGHTVTLEDEDDSAR